MDFTLDTEQVALRDAVRDMLGRRTPADTIGAPIHDADLWRALAEMGLVALPYDEGAGAVEVMLVAEELGRARARTPYADALLAGLVLEATGEKDLLAAHADGEALVLPALSEPGRAWGAPPTVTASGGTLAGTKEPVPYAEAATHLVVSTDAGLHLVAGSRHGLAGARPARPAEAQGLRVDLEATDARLLTDDPHVLRSALNQATVALCAEALGAMSAALDLTVGYLKTRKQFGVPLMTFQTLTHRAADLYVQLELVRSAVQFAAMSMAVDPSDSALVSRTKVVVGKAGRLIGQEAIQMHGGIGMTAEYAVGHLAARLTAIEHTWGDTRQHLTELAEGVSDHIAVDVL